MSERALLAAQDEATIDAMLTEGNQQMQASFYRHLGTYLTHRVRQLKDGWSIVTGDGKPSAHFEHDVALVDGRPVVLSTFDFIYEALGLPKNDPVFA